MRPSPAIVRVGPPIMAATSKLLNLFIRTLAKPIANTIKHQAKDHPTFRSWCVSLAQRKHRAEMTLRTNLLGEKTPNIRPLSEARAIDSGANAIAEGFLFSVAAALILGESWRSSRSLAKRREVVDERIEELGERVGELRERVGGLERRVQEEWREERERNDELTRVLNRIVDIGLRGGWAQLEDTPLRFVRPNREQDSSQQALPPPPLPPLSSSAKDDAKPTTHSDRNDNPHERQV
ncbi:hypothetical protein ACEPAI_5472 [Sanghuangporus weigelae]